MSQPGDRRIEEDIRGISSEVASARGLELVAAKLARAGNRWHIRLDIDRAGPVGVDLGDCQQVSEAVGAMLEERDLIPGRYVLEVSSPGIYRPIRTPDDVRRNRGRRVVVEMREPVEGRRSFRGVLLGLEDDCLRLHEDGGAEVRIPTAGILSARQEVAL